MVNEDEDKDEDENAALPDGADIRVTYRMIRHAMEACPNISEHDVIWLYRIMAEADPFRTERNN
jgi:hypothetical protein